MLPVSSANDGGVKPVECKLSRKVSQEYNKKSKFTVTPYKEYHFMLLPGSGLIAYTAKTGNFHSPILAFQFLHQFTNILTDYKDSKTKLPVVRKDKMCVLQFKNTEDKTTWQEILVNSIGKNATKEIQVLERAVLNQPKIAQLEKTSPQVFFKVEQIDDHEIVQRIQKECEKLRIDSVFKKNRSETAAAAFVSSGVFKDVKLSKRCKYFWLETKQNKEKSPALYLAVVFVNEGCCTIGC